MAVHENGAANEAVETDWTCTEGFYENGLIFAKVPKLANYDPDHMSYNVDVALNGQQFTGKPVNFRYYDVEIKNIEPDFGPSTGGTQVLIQGNGLYDAGIKKIRFSTSDGKSGQREVAADWDRASKSFKVNVPPYQWLFADQEQETEEGQAKL